MSNTTVNGTDTIDTTSALDAIRLEFAKRGGKADPKAVKAAAEAFKKADAAAGKAREAHEAAQAGLFAASKALMEATGAVVVELGGQKLYPSARKGTLFYKRPGASADAMVLE